MKKTSALNRSQIIPFPLPEYLAQFIGFQLNTPVEIINDSIRAKALHIRAHHSLGKMILRSLEESDKPVMVKKGLTMYIRVSEHIKRKDIKLVEARGTFVTLSEKSIEDITEVFKDYFETRMVEFVNGVIAGNNFKKGKRNKAIIMFLEKYNIDFDKSALERYKKIHYREKVAETKGKSLLNKML